MSALCCMTTALGPAAGLGTVAECAIGADAATSPWLTFLEASISCGAGRMSNANPNVWICARGCLHKGSPTEITCGSKGIDPDPVWKHMNRNTNHFSPTDQSCDAAMCFKKKFKEITQPPASDKQQDKIIKAWITRVNGLAQPCAV